MRVINFSDARNQLQRVIDLAVDDADFTVIARRDAQDAVVISLDTFNSLMETLHLMKSPANAKHLGKSISHFRKGQTKTKGLVDAEQAGLDQRCVSRLRLAKPIYKTLKRIDDTWVF